MRLFKLFLIFSFLFNISYSSFPELEGPLSPDYLSHSDRSAHDLIILEQLTTTTVKRVVANCIALLPKQFTLDAQQLSEISPLKISFSHHDILVLRSLRARAPPV